MSCGNRIFIKDELGNDTNIFTSVHIFKLQPIVVGGDGMTYHYKCSCEKEVELKTLCGFLAPEEMELTYKSRMTRIGFLYQ